MMLSRRALLGGLAASAVSRPAWARQDTQDLIDRAMVGIDPEKYADVHVHVVGLGAGDTGCWVHPDMQDFWGHIFEWSRFRIYRHASGVTDLGRADAQYIERLNARIDPLPMKGRFFLLAFDYVHSENGEKQPENSVFHVPNDYVLGLASTHSHFIPVVSVHPYRKDAAEELHRCADAGAVAVKWLPNAQWFDPASPRCDAAYRAMADRGLTLLCHGGEEQAVHAAETQEFGNPLRLRRALDHGVQVIVAHCASYGKNLDLDAPGHPPTSSFSLFLRLMDDPQYVGRLWGEISATVLLNRVRVPLPTLLRRTDLHSRLVHGSDYPIPAVEPLINTWQLWAQGLLRARDRYPLAQIFAHNPLLGEFVLKRILCVDKGPSTGFPPSVFMPSSELFPNLA